MADIDCLLSSLRCSDNVPVTIEIVLAPARSSDFDDRAPPLHLCLHDLCCIHALQLIAREGTASNINDIPFDEVPPVSSPHVLDKALESSLCDVDMACLVYHLQNSDMTDEKCLLKWFTRWQLKCLKNWPDWDNAFDAQLDAHRKAGCIGVPV